jgi:putative Mn2+ efflux pump MntP
MSGVPRRQLRRSSTIQKLIIGAFLFLSLGLDTLAVSIGLGLSGLGRRQQLRYGVSFALAEGLMPLVGFLLGSMVAQAVGDVASFAGIVVLLAVGVYAIREAMREEPPDYREVSSWRLVLLSLSVSLDELAVGFSLSLFGVPVPLAIAYIAAQAFVVTIVGIRLGARLGELLAERAELVSGLALTFLGLLLLAEKLRGA